MEDLDSFWTFQESFLLDELKQKLQYTTYELELTRKETNEEIKKSNEHIKQLLQLLQTTCKERDEAKAQLKKIQYIMACNKKPNNVVNDQIIPTAFSATPFSPDSPLLTTNNVPTKTNSSISESSSFSLETQTNNTNVSSPDSSNVVNFNTLVVGNPTTPTKIVDQIGSDFRSCIKTHNTGACDQESLIIANLARGRPLPPKGELLQAMIKAGPLLSTLMVAGSLPQWQNPPGVLTHQIPPVNLKGSVDTGSNLSIMPITNVSNSSMYNGHVSSSITSGPIRICPSSMLDFGSGSCFMGGRMRLNSGVGFDCQISKRQRII